MRRVIITLVALFATLTYSSAQSANEWLERLDNSLGERFAFDIFVEVGEVDNVEDQLAGFVMVEGDGYYMTLGTMEVYSDGKLRYEINNERKEVVEDRVNLEAVDLLTNPTRAFDFVPEEFYAKVTALSDGSVTLQLTPRSDALGITAITLQLKYSDASVTPATISYDYDGDIITIQLTKVADKELTLRRWDKNAYRAYDIVSFL